MTVQSHSGHPTRGCIPRGFGVGLGGVEGVFGEEGVELLELHVREACPDLADRFEFLLHLRSLGLGFMLHLSL